MLIIRNFNLTSFKSWTYLCVLPTSCVVYQPINHKKIVVYCLIKYLEIIMLLNLSHLVLLLLVGSTGMSLLNLFFIFLLTVLRSGVVSQARGSAYIEMQKTKVTCAVYPCIEL